MPNGFSVIRDCYQAGGKAWPEINLPFATFTALVEPRFNQQAHSDDQRASELDYPELFLACGCAAGDPAALRIFDQQIAAALPAALRRMKLDDASIADVLQQLRIRLFVAAGDQPPRIIGYAGTGKLGALVHVAAKRLALDTIRSQRRIDPNASDDQLATASVISDDAATMLNKAELRQALRRAFEQAATQLPRRDRTLLRMSVLDGLTIDELATMHRVHRATVARWLVAAREQLTADARSRFITLAGLEGSDLGHAGELVESQLTVSLGRLLSSQK